MSIMTEILEIKRMAVMLCTELETVCLPSNDVKLLGRELLNTGFGSLGPVQGMCSYGVIKGPLRLFGMSITSQVRG